MIIRNKHLPSGKTSIAYYKINSNLPDTLPDDCVYAVSTKYINIKI